MLRLSGFAGLTRNQTAFNAAKPLAKKGDTRIFRPANSLGAQAIGFRTLNIFSATPVWLFPFPNWY
jgi:hypothetical protein